MSSGKSMADTWLLAMRCPGYRWRDSSLGSGTELENLCATSAKIIVRNCKRDEGRSFGAGMPVQASNYPERLWSKATVVSVGEKAHVMRQVWTKKVSDKRTNGGVEKVLQGMSKLGSRFCSRISSAGTCLLAERHPAYSWHELGPGSFAERGNPSCDAKRKPYKC